MFESGDVLVAASRVDQENPNLRDLHGSGRVFHLSAQLDVRRELDTGTDGLLVGVGYDQVTGRVLCADTRARRTTWLTHEGRAEPGPAILPERAFGSLLFLPDGRCVLGVHSKLIPTPDDGRGDGKLCLADFAQDTAELLEVDYDGGKRGFHCITHLAQAPGTTQIFYVAEGGKRVLRYDLTTRKQLPDFLRLAAADERGTYGLGILQNGDLLLATGDGFARFDATGRELSHTRVAPGRGWSRLTLNHDASSFFLNNFLEGRIERRRTADGQLLAERNLGVRNCVSGLTEVY